MILQSQGSSINNTESLHSTTTSGLTLQSKLNPMNQNLESVKTPDADIKIPFKSSLNINRAERLMAKEKRDQSISAVLQDAWKCKCMLTSSFNLSEKSKDLKIIDHLEKRNCQQCGCFIIGSGQEEDDFRTPKSPLTLTVSDKNGNTEKRVLFSSDKKQRDEYSTAKIYGSNTKTQKSSGRVKALKQKEDHFFADMSPSEIYSYLRLEESSIRFKQVQGRLGNLNPLMLKTRKHMVESIFEFGDKLKQRNLTIHLAVTFADILLQDEKIFDKIKQETLICTCLLLASKFDEIDDNIPLIRDLQKVCAKQRVVGYEEMLKAEQAVLFKLNWDLFKITPMHFLQNLLGQGVVFSNDRVQLAQQQSILKQNQNSENKTPYRGTQLSSYASNNNLTNANLQEIDEKALKSVKKHTEFFLDLAVQEYDMARTFRPSVIAISSIVLGRRVARIVPEWNPAGLEELTDYTFDGEIKRCSDRLFTIYQKHMGITPNTTVRTPSKPTMSQQVQSHGKSDKKSNTKHNKENQSDKIRSPSLAPRASIVSQGKSSTNAASFVSNTAINKIHFVQKSQVIQEEKEQVSNVSHNTTCSHESGEIAKLLPQLTLQDLLDPNLPFEQSIENCIQLRVEKNKPHNKQQPQAKVTDETKLTNQSYMSSNTDFANGICGLVLQDDQSAKNHNVQSLEDRDKSSQVLGSGQQPKNLNQRIILQLDSEQSLSPSQGDTKSAMYKSQQHTESTDSYNQRGTNTQTSKPVSQVRNSKAHPSNFTTAITSKNQSQAKRQSEYSVSAAQRRNGVPAPSISQNQVPRNLGSNNTSTNQQASQSCLSKTKSQPKLIPSQGQVPSRDATHRLTSGPELTHKIQASGVMTSTQNYKAQTASTFSSAIKVCPTSTKNQKIDDKTLQSTSKKTPTATLMTCKSTLQNAAPQNNKNSTFSSTMNSVANMVPPSRNDCSTSYGNVVLSSNIAQDRQLFEGQMSTSMRKTSDVLQSQKSQIVKKNSSSSTKIHSTHNSTINRGANAQIQLQKQHQQLGLLSQSQSKEKLIDTECQNVAQMLNFDISKENQLQEPRMTLTSQAQNHRHQLSLVPSSSSFPQTFSTAMTQVPSTTSSQQNLQGLQGLISNQRNQTGQTQQSSTVISRTAKKSMDFSSKHSGSQAYNAHRKQAIIQESGKSGSSRVRQTRQPKSSFKTYHEQGESRQVLSTENSMTRVCVFDTQLATQTSLRETSLMVDSRVNRAIKAQIPFESEEESVLSCGKSASKLDLSHQKSAHIISTAKTAKKFAERKKSSMLKNTTLEEIYENNPDRDFVLSPQSQLAAAQAYGVHTVKNSSSSAMQSFSLATIHSATNLQDQSLTMCANNGSQFNNYIQKNISYVNKLNQQMQQKDRKMSDQMNGSMHQNSKSSSNLLLHQGAGSKSITAEKQKLSHKLDIAPISANTTHPYNSTSEYQNDFALVSAGQAELSELDQSLEKLIYKNGTDQMATTFTTRQTKINGHQSMFSQAFTSHNSINQSRTPAAGGISQSVTPSTAAAMQLNQRRASEKQGDYSRPTLSSMSRAKSVAPGQKRPTLPQEKVQPTLVDLENESSTQAATSFEAAAIKNMVKSPTRVGPIQVYEKSKSNLKKSMQNQSALNQNMNETFQRRAKQDASGVKIAQQAYSNFRQQQNSSSMQIRIANEEKSQDGLRNLNQKEDMLNSMIPGSGLSRQSINKRQSFQTQSNMQSRLGNKSQRNSISLSFSMNMQNSTNHFQEDQSYQSSSGKNKLMSLSSQVIHKAKILQNQRQKPLNQSNAHLMQKKQQASLVRKVSQNSQINISTATPSSVDEQNQAVRQKNSSSNLSCSGLNLAPHLHIQTTQQSSSGGNMLSARSISGSAIPEEEELEEGGVLNTFPSPDRHLSKNQESEEEDEEDNEAYLENGCEEIAEEDEQQVTHRYNFEDEDEAVADENNEADESRVNQRSQYFEGDSQDIAEASAILPQKTQNVFKKTSTSRAAVFQVSFDLKN